MDARINDAGLNASFQSGFTEGRAVTDTDDWRFVLGLWFEGIQISMRVFDTKDMPGMLRVMADHLAQGPGTSVTVDAVSSADVTKAQNALVAKAKQAKASLAADGDVVDAELVSDE